MKNIKLGDTEAIFKLPKIAGYRQVFDDNGQPAYRPASPREYFRIGAKMKQVARDLAYTTAYPMFIVEKEEDHKFEFGDIIFHPNKDNRQYYVHDARMVPKRLQVISPLGKYKSFEKRYVMLLRESTEETRAETIALLNGRKL